jgi:hypothetical protein
VAIETSNAPTSMALKVVNPPQKPVTKNNLCSVERCKRYRNIPANATPETFTM